MFALEDNAGAVSEEPIVSISFTSGSAGGANDAAARVMHNARIWTTRRKRGRKPMEPMPARLD
jgi:hypothetical protein